MASLRKSIFAAGDARNLQQVIDQANHVVDLPFHQLRDRCLASASCSVSSLRICSELRIGAQRVSQLVREDGQELVLAAVGVAERRFGPLAVRDVRATFEAPTILSSAPRIGDTVMDTSISPAVLRHAHGFEVLDALTPAQALEDRWLLFLSFGG